MLSDCASAEHPENKTAPKMLQLSEAIKQAQTRLLHRANPSSDPDLHLGDGMSEDDDDDVNWATPQDLGMDDMDGDMSGAEAAPASLQKTTVSLQGMPSTNLQTVTRTFEVGVVARVEGYVAYAGLRQMESSVMQEDDSDDMDGSDDNGDDNDDNEVADEPLTDEDKELLALRA